MKGIVGVPGIGLSLALCLAAPGSPAGDGPGYGRVVTPGGGRLQVEIADTPERRALGYMFRESVGPEDGMLFPFAEESVHSFWMKNVRFPLDLIWIDQEGKVLHVEAAVPPCEKDPCPSYGPMLQALYVLELAEGRAAELGIAPGVQVEILLPDAAPN